ncbi:c-type cytochrome [Acidimangrovimonas pyrenivorans]|uniref:C-type cytochrome n=1 Tax=Acidimangrovimonas pyrenivorans TaxID=2030798 RepID=A0ABV7AH67_9RHOB
MSKFRKLALGTALAAAAFAQPVMAQKLGLGRPALPAEIKAWNIDVRPDGQGLPEGKGNAADGEQIFSERCAVCHGDFGEAVDRWPVLAGGQGTLQARRPVKTIGSYWPYLSTAFDYIHRAMPFGDARTLTADETYSIVAYLLYLNDIVPDDFELSKENFTSVKMPNADGFFMDDRDQGEKIAFTREPCMSDCKTDVKITKTASVLDVTPEGEDAGDTFEGGDVTPVTEAPAGDDQAAADAPKAEEQVASAETAPAEPAPAEPAAAAPDPELVAKGEKVFKKCKACHMVGEGAKNRVGPELTDVIGRTAGTVDGFKYSSAMIDAGKGGLIWTNEALHTYLKKPKDMVPGTKMTFAGLKKESERDAVIAYLDSFKK